MALRCIHCGRSKVTLDYKFECEDRKECAAYVRRKKADPKTVCIYFDCACEGGSFTEGQSLGIGVYTTIDKVHFSDWSGTKFIEHGTVNTGEWTACLYALSVAVLMRKSGENYNFRIFGDSQLVVNQFNDIFKTSNKFKAYKQKAERLRNRLGMSLLSLSWIPREQNKDADILSKQAIKLYRHDQTTMQIGHADRTAENR